MLASNHPTMTVYQCTVFAMFQDKILYLKEKTYKIIAVVCYGQAKLHQYTD
jgi:hypothetical protein